MRRLASKWLQIAPIADNRFGIEERRARAMMSAHPSERVVAAPEALGLETRGSFRRTASHTLDGLPEGSGRLVIDLTATRAVDSAGLGVLILIQRHAAGRRQSVCLRGANEELRLLLVLTSLDDLFELEGVHD